MSPDNARMQMKPACLFIPTLTAGGAERVSALLANAWIGERRVIIITYFDEPHFFKLHPDVEVICLGFSPGRRAMTRSVDIIRAILKFRKLVLSIDPQFVLSFMNKYNVFCLAALAGTNIPITVSERDSPTEALPAIRVFFRDLLYPRAKGVICQTTAGERFINSRWRGLRRTTTIPNPVQRIIAPEERVPERIILAVGRLEPKKAFDHLLEAFSRMHHGETWRLVICGDGSCRTRLEMQAQSLGIADRVEFAGLTKNLDIHYRKAGLFVFSSLFEGYPNALAEAMVSGLPCISYDCPTGPSDIIENGQNGVLVPVGDIDSLANAMDHLVQNPDVAARYGSRAAELSTSLEPSRVAARFLEFCMAGTPDGQLK